LYGTSAAVRRPGRKTDAGSARFGIPQGSDVSGLPASLQLDQVRELAAAARVLSAVLVIAEEPGGSARAQAEREAGPLASGARASRARARGAAAEAETTRERGTAGAPGRGRTVAEESAGVQVGDHCRQFNFYTYEVVTPAFEDLAGRLSRPDVLAATREVAVNPQDASARRALLDALCPGGWWLGGPASRLAITVVRAETTRSGSWLDGTVFFRDVTGGQVGDGNTQRNEFVYTVAPNLQVTELLAANRDLAKALIDCAFSERGRSDTASLARELQSAVASMPVEPPGDRARSELYDPPAPGHTLRIRAHDGASIGRHSTVTREDKVVAQPQRESYSWSHFSDRITAEAADIARHVNSADDRDDIASPAALWSLGRATHGFSAFD
jgi:hypothetical protein